MASLLIIIFAGMTFIFATVFRFSDRLGISAQLPRDAGDDMELEIDPDYADLFWKRVQYVSGLITLLAFALVQSKLL